MNLQNLEKNMIEKIEEKYKELQEEFSNRVSHLVSTKMIQFEKKFQEELSSNIKTISEKEVNDTIQNLFSEIQQLKKEMLSEMDNVLKTEQNNVFTFIDEYKHTIDIKMSLSLKQLDELFQNDMTEITEKYNKSVELIYSSEKTSIANIKTNFNQLISQLDSKRQLLSGELKNQYDSLIINLSFLEREIIKRISTTEKGIKTQTEIELKQISSKLDEIKNSITTDMKLYEQSLEGELSRKKDTLISQIEVDKQSLFNSMTARKDELIELLNQHKTKSIEQIVNKSNSVFQNLALTINGHEKEIQQLNSENLNKFIAEIKNIYEQMKQACLLLKNSINNNIQRTGDIKLQELLTKFEEHQRSLNDLTAKSLQSFNAKKEEILTFFGKTKENGYWKIMLDDLQRTTDSHKSSLSELKSSLNQQLVSSKATLNAELEKTKENALNSIGTTNTTPNSARKNAIDAIELQKNNVIKTIENSIETIRAEGELVNQNAKKDIYQYIEKNKKSLKGEKGNVGENGKSLEFNWDRTRLGIKQEGDSSYSYTDLKGQKGDKGKDLEFNWDGSKLGVRQQGDSSYKFSDLKGKDLEFNWRGTELGVKQEGQNTYSYSQLGITNITQPTPSTMKINYGFDNSSILNLVPGNDLEFNWQGTKLGIRSKGIGEYQYTNLKGEKGDSITSINSIGENQVRIYYGNNQNTVITIPTVKGDTGKSGKDGKSLHFSWSGTQLGILRDGDSSYEYRELKGPKGDKGETGVKGDTGKNGADGKSLNFKWNGTQLGIKYDSETDYQYKDLKGEKGNRGLNGADGKSLEFQWNGTQLGIKQSGMYSYTYQDLKGPKGDRGPQGTQGPRGLQGMQGVGIKNITHQSSGNNLTLDFELTNNTHKQVIVDLSNLSGASGKVVKDVELITTNNFFKFKITYSDETSTVLNLDEPIAKALQELMEELPFLRKDQSGTLNGNLTVQGTLYATDNITAFSDRRLKSNIKIIPNALEKLDKINGYTFDMNNKKRTGVIAQELQKVLPESVVVAENGYLAVDYGSITGLLIQAIKEQQKQIDELRGEKYGTSN